MYKRQVLQKALGKTKYSSLDKKVRELNQDLGKLTTTSYTDAANYSYRLDRNNVDENTENAELASESLRYQLLTTAITDVYKRQDIQCLRTFRAQKGTDAGKTFSRAASHDHTAGACRRWCGAKTGRNFTGA